jgi:hypothetical protein
MTGRGSRRLGVEGEELKSDGSIGALADMRASPRRWGQEESRCASMTRPVPSLGE